jgi:two-component system alkaline phosphatase synthesis response regulator PhoP
MGERILVVDDDRNVVRLLQTYLESSGYTVYTARDGETALQVWRTQRPDLVILDLMLPRRDGWEVTRLVRGDPSLASTPILMLTARVDEPDRILGLELGGDDYVPKPFNPREVLARVRAILRRVHGEMEPRQILIAGCLRIDVDAHDVSVNGQPVHVTPTEFSILCALAECADRTFTRGELMDRALGYTYDGCERTLDSHIRNLRHNLDEAGGQGFGLRAIQTVFGVGYRLCTTPEGAEVEAP